ncbi:MAG: calcium-binding protein [Terriglobia bacterium]
MENKIRFPFRAKCIVAKVVSPLLKGETVEARGMAPEDAYSNDMLLQIRWQYPNMAVPLSQLLAIRGNEATNEAIADWH